MSRRWWAHRWYDEASSLEYHAMNLPDEIVKRGFKQVRGANPALPGFGAQRFVKTA